MPLKIFNTLSKKEEVFAPLNPPHVKMYVCGITPYDETHLGHGRAYVTFDVVRRYLEYSGYQVEYIQNVTDVDDKIINKSNKLAINFNELAERYTNSYFDVMDKLNVRRASKYPRATEHINDMVKWIEGLVKKGFAYVIDKDVYFEVAKFKDYGKLSKRKLKDMQAGARVEIDERKKDPLDFALWKKAKEGEPFWESPWGKGRPGWHIECSVMSTKYLGEQFDIHGGGLDLVFPHHENEIAQAEALTGKQFVKYWIHNGFVTVNKEKMSKSLGNFFTLKDIFKEFDPMVVRYFLLSTHYRSPLNYSDKELSSSREAYGRICKFIENLDFLLSKTPGTAPVIEIEDIEEELVAYKQKFELAMDSDFNTAGGLAAIFETIKFCNKTLEQGENEKECLEIMKKSVIELCEVLGLKIEHRAQSTELGAWVERMLAEREDARKTKNFAKADQIRKQLSEMGITIEDTAYGAKWRKGS